MWYGQRSSAKEARSLQSNFCPPRPNSGISFFRRTSTDDPIGVAKPIPEDRKRNLGVVFQNAKSGYPYPGCFCEREKNCMKQRNCDACNTPSPCFCKALIL